MEQLASIGISKKKELVVISGKGGTGKTSVVSALARLAEGAVFADCDVDASNLPLVLGGKVRWEKPFSGGKQAQILLERCDGCGRCYDLCRFNAIHEKESPEGGLVYSVDPVACEGCGVCLHVCPVRAVEFEPVVNGAWYLSDTAWGPLVYAELGPGEENSGKLVTQVRREAEAVLQAEGRSMIVVDGPPGVGCPVIASITGASLLLVVAEPTPSGQHDLDRALELAKHFRIPALVCINKSSLYPEGSDRLAEHVEAKGGSVIGRLPYDTDLVRVQFDKEAGLEIFPQAWLAALEAMWTEICKRLED